MTSGGTIPDRGLYSVVTPEGTKVGELDEEMVYESRVGEAFLLGSTTWRIDDITPDRVVVTPAPGVPGKMPFWHGDKIGRPYELGRAIGEFVRTVEQMDDATLSGEFNLDQLAMNNLRAYVAEEREATGGALPTDRQIVVQRFRDELGDWQLCVLSPFGPRSTRRGPWPSRPVSVTASAWRPGPSGATTASWSVSPKPTTPLPPTTRSSIPTNSTNCS